MTTHDESTQPDSSEPTLEESAHAGGHRAERTCAVCRNTAEPSELIRWVRDPEGEVFPDLGRSSFGRGAWTHTDVRCLSKLTSGLAKSFKAQVTTSTAEALQRLRGAGDKKVRDLLGAVRRERHFEAGSDAVEEALAAGSAHLVLVAQDARAAAETSGVRRAVAAGKAQSWGNKEILGRICGRSEVGVMAITEERLAAALFGAIALAHLQGAQVNGASEKPVDVLTEVE